MISRIEKLQNQLKIGQAVLIFNDYNRFYFTGFNSSAGILVITKEDAFLFIDFRYFEKAKATISSAEVILAKNTFAQISELFKDKSIAQVYLETETVDIALYRRLKESLCGVEILKNSKIQNTINELRSVKDKKEAEIIKIACEISESTFKYILPRIKAGRTEKEIALDMEFFMRKNGAEAVAFDFIVVSGKNSSLPHGVPTDKEIATGDFVTMDFGAKYQGYCSDMTRTVAVGQVSDKQREVYNTVLKAQEMSLLKIKAGEVCNSIDAVARNYINQSGFKNCFGHGLGHSLGLEIHENPAFNTRDTTVLKSGMVMTVEPGIYLENEFGVRIEDTVLVTETGIKNFMKAEKEIIVL